MKAGADAKAVTKKGATAMSLAKDNGHQTVVEALQKKECDL